MRQDCFARQIVIGLVLGALLLPQTAYAQFGGVVHDPIQTNIHIANFAKTVAKWEKEINHWMEEIEKYNAIIEKGEKTVQGLGSLLNAAEQIAAKDRQLRQTLSTVGKTVRLAFRLKNQIVNSVYNQAKALRRIEERVRHGGAWAWSWQDLEDWLRNDIGRYSEQTIAEEERLIKMDNELDRYLLEQRQAHEHAQAIQKELEDTKLALEMLAESDDTTDKDLQIAKLKEQIPQLEKERERYYERAREFDEKARKRVEMIIKRHEEDVAFGRDVNALQQTWKGVRRAEQKLKDKLNDEARRSDEEAASK